MRRVVFASPEESIVGDESVRSKKHDFMYHLSLDKGEDEAATLIGVAPEEVELWKRQDANFRQGVEKVLSKVRG